MDSHFGNAVRQGRLAVPALIVAFWLLIGPPDRGDQPVWVIQGGYESLASCEASRGGSANPHWLLCVDATVDIASRTSRPPAAASLP